MSREVTNVRISVLPKSSLGRWSVSSAAAIVLLYVLVPVLEYRWHLRRRCFCNRAYQYHKGQGAVYSCFFGGGSRPFRFDWLA